MNALSIDNLAVIGPSVTNYIVDTVSGFDAPAFRISAYDNPGQDGGTIGSSFYGTRALSLAGVVYAQDPAGYLAARRALAYACRIRRDANGFPVPLRITLTALDGAQYFFDANVGALQIDLDHGNVGRFLITMKVPGSFFYGVARQTTGTFGVPSLGGVTYPVTYPATYTGSTGGSGSVTNQGNANSLPLLTLRGALTNPYLYNLETGLGFKLNATVPAGSTVIIDMDARTVVLNGSSSLLAARGSDSNWFAVPPGASTWRLSTSSTGDTGTAEVALYSAYMGL